MGDVRSLSAAVQHLLPAAAGPTDANLVGRFAADRDEAAFALLVRRHGPTVFGVCRRLLRHDQDAEDAFQAVFLVLARKAGGVGRSEAVGNWLYGVAMNVARKARAARSRRQQVEQASGGREPPVRHTGREACATAGLGGTGLPACEAQELAEVIDRELAALPDKYRAAVVLCDLGGRTVRQAAAEVGVPPKTLGTRLLRGRALLAGRLTRRGVTLPAVGLTAAVPSQLLGSVLPLAAGRADVPPAVAALTLGVVPIMTLTTAKWAAVLAVGLLVAAGFAPGPGGPAPVVRAADEPTPEELVKRLGAAEFADREAAGKALRKLGMTAEAALAAGAKSADPETARRAAALLRDVRADERNAFVAGRAERAGPAWKKFREIVGDSKESRSLFAEMTIDPARAAVLDRAAADPAVAAKEYLAAVERAGPIGEAAIKKGMEDAKTARGVPDLDADPTLPKRMTKRSNPTYYYHIVVQTRRAVTQADSAAGLFLGTLVPSPEAVADPLGVRHVLGTSFYDLIGGTRKEVGRRLFVAWLDRRTDPKAVQRGLDTAAYGAVAEALPLARRLAADPKADGGVVGSALVIVGNYGTAADLPLMAKFRDDARPYLVSPVPGQPGWESQVRDAAASMSLHLRGEDPAGHGFPKVGQAFSFDVSLDPLPYRHPAVFYQGAMPGKDAAQREVAQKRAWDWLDAQPKPGPAGR